jgi:hypothetical protein
MNERRRGPRVSLSVPIVEEEFLITTCGVTVNVSEFGLRYFKLAKPSQRTVVKEKYQLQTRIRSVNFSLPKHNYDPMKIMCSVVEEKKNDEFIETSCEFICLTNDQRHAILKFIDLNS